MKGYLILLTVATAAVLTPTVHANQPLSGTLIVMLGEPAGETFPYRVTGSLTTLGVVTGGGRFVWDKQAGAVTSGMLVLSDADGDQLILGFGGFVTPDGKLQAAGFEVFGGTGKWQGALGIGTLNGSIVSPAFFRLRGTLFD